MSQTETLAKFTSRGAEAIGGAVYLDRVVVGNYTADGFRTTEDGERLLATFPQDAETPKTDVKADTKPETKAVKRSKSTDATPPAAAATGQSEAESLLADLDSLGT